MDKTELGCLQAIDFNPDVKGLQDINRVEQLQESLCLSGGVLDTRTKMKMSLDDFAA